MMGELQCSKFSTLVGTTSSEKQPLRYWGIEALVYDGMTETVEEESLFAVSGFSFPLSLHDSFFLQAARIFISCPVSKIISKTILHGHLDCDQTQSEPHASCGHMGVVPLAHSNVLQGLRI